MSQATRCATSGWRGGAPLPLRTPCVPRLCWACGRGARPLVLLGGAPMADRRTAVVRARVLPAEHAAWQAKAAAAGVSPSDLLRQAMARTRTWTARAVAVERERTRQVARIGNNLNQIARWANTHAETAEAVEVIAHLVAIEREIARLARFGEVAAGCTSSSSPAARARPARRPTTCWANGTRPGSRAPASRCFAAIRNRSRPSPTRWRSSTSTARPSSRGPRTTGRPTRRSKPSSTRSRRRRGRDSTRTATRGRRSCTASRAAASTCTC